MVVIMKKRFHPRNNTRRVFLMTLTGLVLGYGRMNESRGENRKMTTVQMTLWQAIDALAQQIPFAKAKIEVALSTTLLEREEPSNELFRFYKSDRIPLRDGTVISTIDLRIKIQGAHPGLLGIDLEGSCITLDDVRRRYNALEITDAPRGRSLQEETVYTAKLPWGELSFGFKEAKPDCLAGIGFNPTRKQ